MSTSSTIFLSVIITLGILMVTYMIYSSGKLSGINEAESRREIMTTDKGNEIMEKLDEINNYQKAHCFN